MKFTNVGPLQDGIFENFISITNGESSSIVEGSGNPFGKNVPPALHVVNNPGDGGTQFRFRSPINTLAIYANCGAKADFFLRLIDAIPLTK